MTVGAELNADSSKAIQYAERVMAAAVDVVGAAQIEQGISGARDPRIVGVTILCRSICYFRSGTILVRCGRLMEARTLARCLYENLLWVGALLERGPEFVQEMIQDEAHNRKSLSEQTLRNTGKFGANLNSPGIRMLREIIKDIRKKFPNAKKLNAAVVAAGGIVETAYIEYKRLSLDGVHCSITALGRHLSHEQIDTDQTRFVVSVEPKTLDGEMLSAILCLCKALMGVAVGVNEILGYTGPGEKLGLLIEEFDNEGWTTN